MLSTKKIENLKFINNTQNLHRCVYLRILQIDGRTDGHIYGRLDGHMD